MTLRIGIDVSATRNPATGIGRYTYELCRALSTLTEGPEMVGFLNVLRRGPTPDLGFPIRNARWPDRLLKGAWRAARWPTVEAFLGPLDVFHASDWVQPPLANSASVSTVHDLGALLHPQWYAPDVVRIHERKNREVAESADLVIAISEHTRRTFLDMFSVDPERIRVIPNGVSAEFKPASATESAAGLLASSLPGPYVLYVGTRERRKNLQGLLEIFSLIAAVDPRLSLVLVGARPWAEAAAVHGARAWTGPEFEDEIAARGLTARVKVLGRVGGEDLRILYSRAECFVFPSLFEGFGLPVLEAMACGCPVVASDRSALPEVVGNAGLTLDPDDASAFADAVLTITSDAARRERLVHAGLERSAQFTWTRTAQMTWEIYREAFALRGLPAALT